MSRRPTEGKDLVHKQAHSDQGNGESKKADREILLRRFAGHI